MHVRIYEAQKSEHNAAAAATTTKNSRSDFFHQTVGVVYLHAFLGTATLTSDASFHK